MGPLFEMLLGMLLGGASYALLCKWLAYRVNKEIYGDTGKVSLRKLTESKRKLGGAGRARALTPEKQA